MKGWLVDKFGGLLTWISNAAKFIGDKYKALKNTLGFGGGPEAANDNPAPPKLAPTPDVPRPKRTVDLEKPGKEKKAHEKKGRDTKYDAENREQLRAQIDLEAARLRGDRETEQVLQDKLDLSKQIEAYQRTGLTLDQARAAASRDMKDLAAARAVQSGMRRPSVPSVRPIGASRRRHDISRPPRASCTIASPTIRRGLSIVRIDP
ncbi:hypothetical protein [Sphingomonas sp. PP-CE-3G-477]|uniref:hypothetical protein n=1 Tax=Sphingomonas sp. PP-CE-3G-477 TaxID=2135660 RepID=UPI0015E66578|nr:hypothetical protein [Sphingomonas sp. PP-CE-3G-477]